MNKKSYQIIHLYNKDIKVGNNVYLTDGSALTLLDDDDKFISDNYYLSQPYLHITGSRLILKEIKGIVTEINIKDRITIGPIDAYSQDIIVQIGKAKFRTCSALVKQV